MEFAPDWLEISNPFKYREKDLVVFRLDTIKVTVWLWEYSTGVSGVIVGATASTYDGGGPPSRACSVIVTDPL